MGNQPSARIAYPSLNQNATAKRGLLRRNSSEQRKATGRLNHDIRAGCSGSPQRKTDHLRLNRRVTGYFRELDNEMDSWLKETRAQHCANLTGQSQIPAAEILAHFPFANSSPAPLSAKGTGIGGFLVESPQLRRTRPVEGRSMRRSLVSWPSEGNSLVETERVLWDGLQIEAMEDVMLPRAGASEVGVAPSPSMQGAFGLNDKGSQQLSAGHNAAIANIHRCLAVKAALLDAQIQARGQRTADLLRKGLGLVNEVLTVAEDPTLVTDMQNLALETERRRAERRLNQELQDHVVAHGTGFSTEDSAC